MGELDRPIVVDLPLRGEWTVERTPADRIPSHGTDLFGQRYAYDFIRTDDRAGAHVHPAGSLRWLLFGGRTRDCYGWGQPVHAALGGEVVDAVDGVRERQWLHVVRESWVAAHLAPGSVAVASGQHVAVGEAIGRVGQRQLDCPPPALPADGLSR